MIHSHDVSCVLASALFPASSTYRISRQEMIKGMAGHGYLDELVIPIIENTPRESDLADSLSEAIVAHPRASAVLVRDHGLYVWGDSWEEAKRHSECLHYLFNLSVQLHRAGIGAPPAPPPLPAPPLRCTCCGASGNSAAASASPKTLASSPAGTTGRCDISSAKFVLLDIEGMLFNGCEQLHTPHMINAHVCVYLFV